MSKRSKKRRSRYAIKPVTAPPEKAKKFPDITRREMCRQMRKRYCAAVNRLVPQALDGPVMSAKMLLSGTRNVDPGKFVHSHRTMGRSKVCGSTCCLLAFIDKVAWEINEYLSERRAEHLIPMVYLIKLEKIAEKGVT